MMTLLPSTSINLSVEPLRQISEPLSFTPTPRKKNVRQVCKQVSRISHVIALQFITNDRNKSFTFFEYLRAQKYQDLH